MGGRAKFEAAALALRATYPWSIVPIRNDGQGRKKAACKWEQYQTRRPSSEEIRHLFRRGDLTGLAVILGAVSGGLYGRDFDVMESYHRWATQYPGLARLLPTVATGRGRHVYAYHGGQVRTIDFGDGELRGENHYIVLPPSLHPSGRRYAWVVPPRGPCAEVTIAPDVAGLARSWCPKAEEQREQRGTEGAEVSDGFRGFRCGEGGAPLAGERASDVAELIRLALPDDEHQNHAKLFFLARGVKAQEDREGRVWSESEMWERIFLPWYNQNQHLREGEAREAYWLEFLEAYDDVKCPLGQGVLERTWQAALTCHPPTEAQRFKDPRNRLLVAWCRELQRVAGDGPFFLACRTVAAKLGLGSSHGGSAYLRRMEREGILAVVEKGGPATNRATRYRYNGEL